MVLTGTEVKAAQDGKVQLKDSYAAVIGNEAWLVNAHISQYSHGNHVESPAGAQPQAAAASPRNRQAAGHHAGKGTVADSDQTVPERGPDQVEFAVARGKKLHDKRETERAREAESEARGGHPSGANARELMTNLMTRN